MHEIYADPKKLRAPNTMNGKLGKKDKPFSVTFTPGETTKVKNDEYTCLLAEEGGVFGLLLGDETLLERASGDEKKPQEDPPDAVKEAEDALMAAEDELVKSTNAEEKKAALANVKAAKKVLTAAQKAAKKA